MQKEQPNERELKALRFLRNAIVHEGYSPSVRDLAQALGYKSPRTAFLVLNSLIEQGWLKRRIDGELQLKRDMATSEDHARTIEVPLVGSVACGVPILAEENIEAHIPVSTSLVKPGHKYFFLRAVGDSMDAAGIHDGDLMLVRQQPQAENGEKIVALVNDEATVKEFYREREMVVLKPRSKNPKHKPIIVTDNFIIQGVVTSILPANLY
jgi:repressor LexA